MGNGKLRQFRRQGERLREYVRRQAYMEDQAQVSQDSTDQVVRAIDGHSVAVTNYVRVLSGFAQSWEDTLESGFYNVTERLDAVIEGLDEVDRTLMIGFTGLQKETQEVAARVQDLDATVDRGFGNLGRTITLGLEGVDETVSRGFDRLDLGVRDLGDIIRTGLNGVSDEIVDMSVTLGKLLRGNRTRTKDGAYEQFDIARRAYALEAFPEALASIRRAIRGEPGILVGYVLEPRFHWLLGLLLIERETRDLPTAETAFLDACKYAKKERPVMAAKAASIAALIAYCLGEFARARRHVSVALDLETEDTDIQFQAAKYAAADGDEESVVLLERCTYFDQGDEGEGALFWDVVERDPDFAPFLPLIRKRRADIIGEEMEEAAVLYAEEMAARTREAKAREEREEAERIRFQEAKRVHAEWLHRLAEKEQAKRDAERIRQEQEQARRKRVQEEWEEAERRRKETRDRQAALRQSLRVYATDAWCLYGEAALRLEQDVERISGYATASRQGVKYVLRMWRRAIGPEDTLISQDAYDSLKADVNKGIEAAQQFVREEDRRRVERARREKELEEQRKQDLRRHSSQELAKKCELERRHRLFQVKDCAQCKRERTWWMRTQRRLVGILTIPWLLMGFSPGKQAVKH